MIIATYHYKISPQAEINTANHDYKISLQAEINTANHDYKIQADGVLKINGENVNVKCASEDTAQRVSSAELKHRY